MHPRATLSPSSTFNSEMQKNGAFLHSQAGSETFELEGIVSPTSSIILNTAILSRIQDQFIDKDAIRWGGKAQSRGGFSEVFAGQLSQEGRVTNVAVKRLRFHVADQDFAKIFETEVYVWSKLRHRNILKLLGYTYCPETEYPLLISEWMENGTAWSYVKNKVDLSLRDIQFLIQGIASGLAYLHESGVIHSDVKADNVLISHEREPLLCDFGCARMTQYTQSVAAITSTLKGTHAYMAPELIDPDKKASHSERTDVWAFGMTVYELIMQRRPFEGLNDSQVLWKIMRGAMPTFDYPSLYLFTSQDELQELQQLCKNCWAADAALRPTLQEISKALDEKFDDDDYSTLSTVHESANDKTTADSDLDSISMRSVRLDFFTPKELKQQRQPFRKKASQLIHSSSMKANISRYVVQVAGVSETCTEGILKSVFSRFGVVRTTKIKLFHNQQNQGYVEYLTKESAQRAVKEFNSAEIGSRAAYVSLVDWDAKFHVLRVGALHQSVDDKMLWETFAEFRSLSIAQVQVHPKQRTSPRYGFVAFRDLEDAKEARATKNGCFIGGNRMQGEVSIKWAYKDQHDRFLAKNRDQLLELL